MWKVQADKIFDGQTHENLFEQVIEDWFYGFGWDAENKKVTVSPDAQILESRTTFDYYDASFELKDVITYYGKRLEFTDEQLTQLKEMGFMCFWVNYTDETLPHNKNTNTNKYNEDYYFLGK